MVVSCLSSSDFKTQISALSTSCSTWVAAEGQAEIRECEQAALEDLEADPCWIKRTRHELLAGRRNQKYVCIGGWKCVCSVIGI